MVTRRRRQRDYRAEYQRRIERGLARGLTRKEAAGHGMPRMPQPPERIAETGAPDAIEEPAGTREWLSRNAPPWINQGVERGLPLGAAMQMVRAGVRHPDRWDEIQVHFEFTTMRAVAVILYKRGDGEVLVLNIGSAEGFTRWAQEQQDVEVSSTRDVHRTP